MVEVLDSDVCLAPVPYAPQDSWHARVGRLISGIRRDLQVIELPVEHRFAHKTYCRVLHHHAGHVLVGKIHKHTNVLAMLDGEAILVDESGERRVKAPQVWTTPAGVQRAAIALTDCVWMSVHGTDETDLKKIEAEFIAQDALEYEQFLLENKGA